MLRTPAVGDASLFGMMHGDRPCSGVTSQVFCPPTRHCPGRQVLPGARLVRASAPGGELHRHLYGIRRRLRKGGDRPEAVDMALEEPCQWLCGLRARSTVAAAMSGRSLSWCRRATEAAATGLRES